MKRQKKYTLLEFTDEFAGRPAGHREYFDPGHAGEIIKRGVAKKVDSEAVQTPAKEPETKIKKIKIKK